MADLTPGVTGAGKSAITSAITALKNGLAETNRTVASLTASLMARPHSVIPALANGMPAVWGLATLAQITADQNNYAIGDGHAFRLSSDAARNVTGIIGGVNGRLVLLVNAGAQNIVLINESASSTDVNRIITGTGADVTLAGAENTFMIYDGVSARWRLIV